MKAENLSLVERAVMYLCVVVLWVTTTVTFLILTTNTMLRYSTGSSLQWANELPELLFPWLVMAGVVMAAIHGAHIATTFLMEAVAPGVARAVAVIGWLLVTALYGTLAVNTYKLLDIVHDEKTPILQVPGSVTYGCMTGAMGLLALLALQSAVRAARANHAAGLTLDEEGHINVAQG